MRLCADLSVVECRSGSADKDFMWLECGGDRGLDQTNRVVRWERIRRAEDEGDHDEGDRVV